MFNALKILVITMGIIIAIGVAALIYGIYHNAKKLDFHSEIITPTIEFSNKTLQIPKDCQIAEMKPDGKMLYIRLQSDNASEEKSKVLRKCQVILIINTNTGKMTGSLKASP